MTIPKSNETFFLKAGDPRLDAERALQCAALKAFHNLCVTLGLRYYLAYGTLLGAIRHGGYIPWDDDLDLMMPRSDYETFLKHHNQLDSERFFVQTPDCDPGYPGPFAKIRCHHSLMHEAVSPEGRYHEGIFIDIFPLDEAPTTPESQRRRGLHYLIWHLSIRRKLQGYMPERRLVRVVTSILSKLPVDRLKQRREKIMVKDNARPKGSPYVAAYPASASDMRDCFFKRLPLGTPKCAKFQGVDTYIPEDSHAHLTEIFGDYMQLPPEEQRRGHELLKLIIDSTFWADEITEYMQKFREYSHDII